jgi:phospholipid/cholesterol/gamma-HCH transport system ATP-binding protein
MSSPPIIRVVNLHKSFGEHHVLSGINLSIREGSTLVVLGGSGSGKTVLMKHLIGLLKPDEGQVWVEGEDVVPLGDEALARVRRKFGMVFQAAALFDSMTVFENVAFPLRESASGKSEEEIREIVHSRLALFDLRGIDEKFPADLSGGMRKRVGLARAIVLNPKIVLYDEPTTGLDPITTDYVDGMILQAKASLGVTSVVISHDVASAFKVADEVAFLAQGKILELASPSALRSSKIPEVQRFLDSWFRKNE